MMKYKKESISKLFDILSRPPILKIVTLGTLMHMDPFTQDAYGDAYLEGEDLKEVF